MTLARFLENKGYTENEIDETLIRLDCGMDIPEEVWKDIREYNKLDIKFPKIPEERNIVTMFYDSSDMAETIYDFMMSRSDEELMDFNESNMTYAEYVFYYLQKEFKEYCEAFGINVVFR